MQRRTLLSASIGLGALTGLTAAAVSWLQASTEQPPQEGLMLHTGSALAFGTTVNIKVMHSDAGLAMDAIHAALQLVKKVDALMSLHQESSQVFALNRYGVLDAPDEHLLFVLSFSQQLSKLTAGAYDITVQPLWNVFSQAHAKGLLPDNETVAAAQSLVGWRNLNVSQNQVSFSTTGMAITLNGVAQGYAVDLAMEALQTRGVQHALLDTGEFGALGRKEAQAPWMLGVAHPRQSGTLAAQLKMNNRRVATSGDYETFFSPDFLHHHIFDPAVGDSPLELASVTVLAPTGILADGLSTAFMVTGADKALALAAQLQDIDVMLIDKSGGIRQSAHFSNVLV